MVSAPSRVDTDRLTLVRPAPSDAREIFERYAGDPAVTRYLSWPTHRSLDDTRAFLAFSEATWMRDGVGPYLIRTLGDARLIGGTGLDLIDDTETGAGADAPPALEAMTGYVLASNAWGLGFATEALAAMVETARGIGLERLLALCHSEHRASQRVLEKCGFERQIRRASRIVFPNLTGGEPQDVVCYARAIRAR